MCIFHPKTSEQNFRVTIWYIVAIFVWIEQQVRGLHHEYTPVTDRKPGAKIQSSDKIFVATGMTIRIEIIADGDLVGAFGPAWWWFGDVVVGRAQILIDFDRLQSSRRGILNILQHPKPPAIIKVEAQ